MIKLNAKQLRKSEPKSKEIEKIKRNPIYLVLDEIIDTYNIGSLFRLADAVAVEKMYLCGDMEYPPNSRIKKAAVGTQKWVPWEKVDSTIELLEKLKEQGTQIIAVEQDKHSISYNKLTPDYPVAIIVGNETGGIKKSTLKMADVIVELPMHGVNKSFNVWGSAAVVCYKVLESL
ncbi:MAG: TrmH family RNA methyltransferase [Candidatus Woesebacteria bacterium]|jgi:tRNA G18 (ribose-2'-O)-methylase SpoU